MWEPHPDLYKPGSSRPVKDGKPPVCNDAPKFLGSTQRKSVDSPRSAAPTASAAGEISPGKIMGRDQLQLVDHLLIPKPPNWYLMLLAAFLSSNYSSSSEGSNYRAEDTADAQTATEQIEHIQDQAD